MALNPMRLTFAAPEMFYEGSDENGVNLFTVELMLEPSDRLYKDLSELLEGSFDSPVAKRIFVEQTISELRRQQISDYVSRCISKTLD